MSGHGKKSRSNVQSNQPFVAESNSQPQPDRPKNEAGAKTFTLLVDKMPYEVRIEPFVFNGEKRFYVSVNSMEHVFAWDSEVTGFRAIDDDASDLSDVIEEAINQKLQSKQI
jgi:hypothetical protein